MATPMSAAQFAAVLRAEGVTVVEVGDWTTHNRNHMGPWGPVNGVMIHHTVTSGSARTVDICRTGYASLPGPLCHGVITKDGTVHLVGYGRANHAGSGDPDVLQAVINETALPADNEATTDGNARFYGFECENLGDGNDPWPPRQMLAIERVSAAICRQHGWSERSVIGHLEWQPGKVDPRGFTMTSMRARIAARLDRQQAKEEWEMTDFRTELLAALKDKDVRQALVGAIFRTDDVVDAPHSRGNPGNKYWWVQTHLNETFDKLSALATAVDSLAVGGVDVDAIAEQVADKLAERLAE